MDGCASSGWDHYPPPFPNCMPLAPQMRCKPSRQTPGSHCGQGSSQIPSSKVVLGHVWHATNLVQLVQGRGLWIFGHWHWWVWKVISCLSTSWGWLFPTQEFLEVGLQWWQTLQIFISFDFPWPWPIGLFLWCYLSLPHWQGQLVGHIYSGITFWALFCWQGFPLFSKGHQCFCLVGLVDWVHSWTVPIWHGVAWGNHWWKLTSILSAWGSSGCPKDLDLLCQWLPECQWLVRHPWLVEQLILSIFLQILWLPAGLISEHPSLGPWFPHMSLLVCAAIHSSKLSTGIRPRGISWQLLLLCLWLCRWLLEPEVFLKGVKTSRWRCSFMAFSHQPLLGSLWSWYMSWYWSSMSWHIKLGPTSSMAVDSASRSHSSNGSLQPQQMAWLHSLCPIVVACKNICWQMNLWWRLLGIHNLCSWR